MRIFSLGSTSLCSNETVVNVPVNAFVQSAFVSKYMAFSLILSMPKFLPVNSSLIACIKGLCYIVQSRG